MTSLEAEETAGSPLIPLFAALLFLTPLLRGCWDPWSQTLVHVAIAGLAALAAFRGAFDRTDPRFLWISAAWIAAAVWSAARSAFPHSALPGLLNDVTAPAFAALACWAADRGDEADVLEAVAASAALLAAFSLAAPALRRLFGESGLLLNPNVLASYLILALPIVIGLAISSRGPRRGAWMAAGALAVAALLRGRSLTGVVVAGGQIGALLFFRTRRDARQRRLFLAGLAAAAAAAVGIGLGLHWADLSQIERIRWAQSAWRMFAANPLVGAGPGVFGEAFPAFRPAALAIENTLFAHNFVLELLAERGLIGALAFLGLLALAFRPGERPGKTLLSVGLGGFFLYNLLHFGLSVPGVAWPAWALLGVLLTRPDADAADNRRAVAAAAAFVLLASAAQSVRLFRADRRIALARAAAADGRWDDASGHAGSAIGMNSASPEPYSILAAARARRGRVDEAERLLREAVRLSPYTARFHAEIAECLVAENKLPQAYEEMNTAAGYNPLSPAYRFRCGEIMAALKNEDGARADFETVLELLRLRPGLPQDYADRARERLAALGS